MTNRDSLGSHFRGAHVDMTIRRLKAGDERAASRVAAVFKSAVLATAAAGRFLANPANYLIIAEFGERLAGFVLAYRIDRLDRPQGQLFVYEVAVLPEFQRQGIGTRLMEEIRRIVTDEHLMEAFVVTDRVNQSARHLFDRTGAYVEAGESMVYVYPSHAA
jgi:ribosomal protein S18 acetylase RimI-like enzyme